MKINKEKQLDLKWLEIGIVINDNFKNSDGWTPILPNLNHPVAPFIIGIRDGHILAPIHINDKIISELSNINLFQLFLLYFL